MYLLCFTVLFTRFLLKPLICASGIHSMPFLLISWRVSIPFPSTAIISQWSLSIRLPHKTLYPFVSHTCHVFPPSCPPCLIIGIAFGEDHRWWSSLLCNCLHSPLIFPVLSPDLFPQHLPWTPSVYVPWCKYVFHCLFCYFLHVV